MAPTGFRGLSALLTISFLPFVGSPLLAATLYVDPSLGGPCTDYDPTSRACGAGADDAYADLGAAVGLAVPGDEVILRAGDHPGPLIPTVSGTSGAPIRIAAYPGEAPFLTGGASPAVIQLDNVSYLILSGLTVQDARWVEATDVHHITLEGNTFLRTPASGTTGNVRFIRSDHNRILANRLEEGNDNLLLIDSHHNLVQGNTLAEGGHSLLSVRCSTYNVFRANHFSNTIQKIGEVYDCGADTSAVPNAFDATSRNLFEHNTFAAAVTYYSTSGGNGIQYAGQDGIIRRNVFYQTNVGLGMQVYSDEALYNHENRIYHNVFHDNHCAGVSVSGNGVDNVFVNNVLAGNHGVAGDCFGEGTAQLLYRNPLAEILFRGNAFWAGTAGAAVIQDEFDTGGTLAAFETSHPTLFQDNLEADPAFTNATARDYTPTSGSPLVDAGLFLTRATAGGSGTTLPVQDARYFYDGFGIEGEAGDLLQLEADTATATVLGVDLATNELTLSSSLTWTADQGVGLAYQGSAPDVGVFELGATTCGDDICELGETCGTCRADCGPCPQPDGGVGPEVDGGVTPDGGLPPDPDGGTDPATSDDGCGCAADPTDASPAPTLVLLLLGLFLHFTRRRWQGRS